MQKTFDKLDKPDLPDCLDDAHKVIKDLYVRLDRTHKSYEQQIDFYKDKIRLLANKLLAAKSDSVAVSLFHEMNYPDQSSRSLTRAFRYGLSFVLQRAGNPTLHT